MTGQATKTSLLKLGLVELGKYIHPAFLALNGTVLTVNVIVGGALVITSALVNGLFLAISADIAYLGKLASDKERGSRPEVQRDPRPSSLTMH
ncbi:hypothetical protein N0V82_000146 [Gnomoniopsis sp. IMI 355080]|nr:hypothetical protein N0V82_000146 [Gnomoniopsis sp. IMI 355080]